MLHARFLLAGVGAALAMAACGAKVTVDLGGLGGSTGSGAAGTGAGGSFQDTVGASVTAVSGTAVGSTGGGGCASTCVEALLGGGNVCSSNGLGSMNYTALYTCGCGASPCSQACDVSLCTGTPLDPGCKQCLSKACGDALQACEGS